MKKVISISIALMTVISLLCGCSAATTVQPTPTAAPEATAEPTPTPTVEATPVPTAEPAAEPADPYSAVLDLYYTALSEGWEGEKLFNSDVNFLCSYCTEGGMLNNVGYITADVDSDGVEELLIGSLTNDDYLRDVIFDLYTVSDSQCVQVFASQERQRYFMGTDGSFITDWANSALDSGLYAMSYSNGQLTEIGPVDVPEYMHLELTPFASYK